MHILRKAIIIIIGFVVACVLIGMVQNRRSDNNTVPQQYNTTRQANTNTDSNSNAQQQRYNQNRLNQHNIDNENKTYDYTHYNGSRSYLNATGVTGGHKNINVRMTK